MAVAGAKPDEIHGIRDARRETVHVNCVTFALSALGFAAGAG
jgi:hypothetical protein